MPLRDLPRFVARLLSPARAARRVRVLLGTSSVAALRARARWSRRSLTGDAPVVVCLTSYGPRLRSVHLAVESIGGGSVRPRRLVLWLDDEQALADPPPALARMVARGLEIAPTPDWGPHKKYYPYAASLPAHEVPLVTADDDVLYGRRWLEQLVAVHRRHPRDVVAHRAHRVVLREGRIAPYARWADLDHGEAGPRTFATGASGVLYPPAMLDALREAGTAFTACAPRADDIWLHAVALRTGTTVRPVSDGLTGYRAVPGTSLSGLRTRNVLRGGNDAQVAATYTPDEVALLWRDQASP